MSQDPFAAPPSETPGALPPNRVPPPSGRRMLGVWLFLALFILAAWHIAGGPLAAPSPAALAPLLLVRLDARGPGAAAGPAPGALPHR
jgi:hypothetical protein